MHIFKHIFPRRKFIIVFTFFIHIGFRFCQVRYCDKYLQEAGKWSEEDFSLHSQCSIRFVRLCTHHFTQKTVLEAVYTIYIHSFCYQRIIPSNYMNLSLISDSYICSDNRNKEKIHCYNHRIFTVVIRIVLNPIFWSLFFTRNNFFS